MKNLVVAVVIALMSSDAFAQTSGSTSAAAQPPGAAVDVGLGTAPGHEVNVSVGGYTYTEPGDLNISIHGPKLGGGYTGTLSLGKSRHWFTQADVRGTIGNVTYDGWCSPFLITPDSTSPNGYALDLGDASPCSESGDSDWYVEARGLVGRMLSIRFGLLIECLVELCAQGIRVVTVQSPLLHVAYNANDFRLFPWFRAPANPLA